MPDAQELENLRTAYKELAQSHRTITDFRARLLALLPLASGTGLFLLLTKKDEPLEPVHLVAIGLFGFFATFGLFLHELRGIKECGDLLIAGMRLEDKLGWSEGMFARADRYHASKLRSVVGPVGAAWIIYPALLTAWGYVALVPVWDRERPPASTSTGLVTCSVALSCDPSRLESRLPPVDLDAVDR